MDTPAETTCEAMALYPPPWVCELPVGHGGDHHACRFDPDEHARQVARLRALADRKDAP